MTDPSGIHPKEIENGANTVNLKDSFSPQKDAKYDRCDVSFPAAEDENTKQKKVPSKNLNGGGIAEEVKPKEVLDVPYYYPMFKDIKFSEKEAASSKIMACYLKILKKVCDIGKRFRMKGQSLEINRGVVNLFQRNINNFSNSTNTYLILGLIILHCRSTNKFQEAIEQFLNEKLYLKGKRKKKNCNVGKEALKAEKLNDDDLDIVQRAIQDEDGRHLNDFVISNGHIFLPKDFYSLIATRLSKYDHSYLNSEEFKSMISDNSRLNYFRNLSMKEANKLRRENTTYDFEYENTDNFVDLLGGNISDLLKQEERKLNVGDSNNGIEGSFVESEMDLFMKELKDKILPDFYNDLNVEKLQQLNDGQEPSTSKFFENYILEKMESGQKNRKLVILKDKDYIRFNEQNFVSQMNQLNKITIDDSKELFKENIKVIFENKLLEEFNDSLKYKELELNDLIRGQNDRIRLNSLNGLESELLSFQNFNGNHLNSMCNDHCNYANENVGDNANAGVNFPSEELLVSNGDINEAPHPNIFSSMQSDSELFSLLSETLAEYPNYHVINIPILARKVEEKYETFKTLNDKSKNSIVFYYLIMLSQMDKIDLVQEECFGDIKLIKNY